MPMHMPPPMPMQTPPPMPMPWTQGMQFNPCPPMLPRSNPPGVEAKSHPPSADQAPNTSSYWRSCSRCKESAYLRNGCCLNPSCTLSLGSQKPDEASQRLFRWGRQGFPLTTTVQYPWLRIARCSRFRSKLHCQLNQGPCKTP